MKESHTCPKCGRRKIWHLDTVRERAEPEWPVPLRVLFWKGTAEGGGFELFACATCGISYDDPAPNSFSFNSPYGSCPACAGLGETKEFDVRLIIPDKSLSLNREGIAPLGKPRETWFWQQVRAVAAKHGIPLDAPVGELSKAQMDILLHGGGDEKYEIPYTYSSGRVVKYRQKFGGDPDAIGGLAYDAANVLFGCLQRFAAEDPEGFRGLGSSRAGSEERKAATRKLRDRIAATKDYAGVTGMITLDANRNASKPAVIIEIRDGAKVYNTSIQPAPPA